jgi:photosystem II stability/assembly factor-like uncharacterized protein
MRFALVLPVALIGCAPVCDDDSGPGTFQLTDWHAGSVGSDVNLYGAALDDAGAGFVVGDAGTILETADGGETWTTSASGTDLTLYGVAQGNGRSWVSGDQGLFLVNEGSGWEEVYGLDTNFPLYGVSAAGDVVAAVGDQTAWVSEDAGGEWRDVGGTWRVRAVEVRSADVIFAVGDDGLFMRWNDITWVPRTTGVTASLRALAFESDTNGVAVGMGGAVILTADGGETWTAATTTPTDDLYGVTFSSNAYLAVGAGGTIWRSTDGGDSWSSLYESGLERLTDIDAFQDDTMIGDQFLAPGFGGNLVLYGTREVEDTAADWDTTDGCG